MPALLGLVSIDNLDIYHPGILEVPYISLVPSLTNSALGVLPFGCLGRS